MRPEDQKAWQREQQRQADNVRYQEQSRRANDAANRKANQAYWQNFNASQEQNRRESQQRQRDQQAERERHDNDLRNRRARYEQEQRPQAAGPWRKPDASQPDFEQSTLAFEHAATKRKGGFGKAALFIVGMILAIGYFGSHSDNSPIGRTSIPEAATPSMSAPTQSYNPPTEQTPDPAAAPPVQALPAPEPEVSARQYPAVPTPVPEAPVGRYPPQQQTPLYPPPPAPIQQAPTLQLMNRIQPVYPALAKQARIQGTVSVVVEVGPDGSVVNARADRGSPILVKAALEAARQWRYAPYTPIPEQPFLTSVLTFNFNLQ